MGAHRLGRTRARSTVVAAGLVIAVGTGCAAEGAVGSLEVGTCLDEPPTERGIEEVAVVDCDEPHSYEVVALFDLEEGAYPGSEALGEEAVDGCETRLEELVGAAPEESSLRAAALVPTGGGWDDGDREVVCLAASLDGPTTGSIVDDPS